MSGTPENAETGRNLTIGPAFLREPSFDVRQGYPIDITIGGFNYPIVIFTFTASSGPTAAEHSYSGGASIKLMGQHGIRELFPEKHSTYSSYGGKRPEGIDKAGIMLNEEEEDKLLQGLRALIMTEINKRKNISWSELFTQPALVEELMEAVRQGVPTISI